MCAPLALLFVAYAHLSLREIGLNITTLAGMTLQKFSRIANEV